MQDVWDRNRKHYKDTKQEALNDIEYTGMIEQKQEVPVMAIEWGIPI